MLLNPLKHSCCYICHIVWHFRTANLSLFVSYDFCNRYELVSWKELNGCSPEGDAVRLLYHRNWSCIHLCIIRVIFLLCTDRFLRKVLQHFVSILSWKNSPYFLCVLLSYICKHKTNRHSFIRTYLSLKFSKTAVVIHCDYIRLVPSVSFQHSGS
jgi:hypothetical protein